VPVWHHQPLVLGHNRWERKERVDVGTPHLPQSGTELEEFFDLTIDLLCIVGFDGYFKRVNPSLERTLGYPRPELFSRSVLDITHPDDVQPSREALAQLAEGHDLVGFESRVMCADGSVRWLEWNTRTMPERGVVYGVARDTTERRRADAEVREAQRMVEESRDELRVLADEQAALRRVATLVARGTAPDAVFAAVGREVGEMLGVDATHLGRYEADGTVVSVAQWGRYSGVPIGAPFPLEGDSVSARVLRTGKPARIDNYADAPGVIATTMREIGIRVSVGVPISIEGRTWGVMIATSRDANPFPVETESRLQHFTELLATAIANADSRDQLTASRARVLAAGDDARRRVVRDLHDGAQQRLVHTVVTLKLMQRALHGGRSDAEGLLADALDSAERATAELRELSHGILPSVISRGGLRAGVDAFVSRLDVPVDVDVSSERLPPDMEASAYFIVAEALTNVVKHARATQATVRAAVDDRVLTLEVRDDGVGGANPEGHGLVGIADRVDALGGRLRIESANGDGTVLAARLPVASR
jgi:PAS domain S-box-containing protein